MPSSGAGSSTTGSLRDGHPVVGCCGGRSRRCVLLLVPSLRRMESASHSPVSPGLKRSFGTRPLSGSARHEIADTGELTLDPVEPLVPPAFAVADLDFGNLEAIGGKDSIAKDAGLLDVRDGPPVGGTDRAPSARRTTQRQGVATRPDVGGRQCASRHRRVQRWDAGTKRHRDASFLGSPSRVRTSRNPPHLRRHHRRHRSCTCSLSCLRGCECRNNVNGASTLPSRQGLLERERPPGGLCEVCENPHRPTPSRQGLLGRPQGGSLPSRSARLVRPRRPGRTRRNRTNCKGIATHASVNRDRGRL